MIPFLLTLLFLSPGLATAKDTADGLGPVSEILMPPYQASALEHEQPVADLRFSGPKQLLILGQDSLFQWDIDGRKLQRLTLTKEAEREQSGALAKLGSDGVNLFAAADGALFQIQWQDGRVFRYQNAAANGGHALSFAGDGDDFWWVHDLALFRFDRYGKTLTPQRRVPLLVNASHAVMDAKAQVLWFEKGKRLFRLDLTREDSQPVAVLQAKHTLIDLQMVGHEVISPTAHSVLRVDALGKLKQSIPVEGSRQLLAMHVTPEAHAYLFNDQLLEVFVPKGQLAFRYRLPLEDGEKVTKLELNGLRLALIVGGKPRVFTLGRKP